MGLIDKVVEHIALEASSDLLNGAIDKTKAVLDKMADAAEKKSKKNYNHFWIKTLRMLIFF